MRGIAQHSNFAYPAHSVWQPCCAASSGSWTCDRRLRYTKVITEECFPISLLHPMHPFNVVLSCKEQMEHGIRHHCTQAYTSYMSTLHSELCTWHAQCRLHVHTHLECKFNSAYLAHPYMVIGKAVTLLL